MTLKYTKMQTLGLSITLKNQMQKKQEKRSHEEKGRFKYLALRAKNREIKSNYFTKKKPFKLSKYYCKTMLYSNYTNEKFQCKRKFKRCKCRTRILVYKKSLLKSNFSLKKL